MRRLFVGLASACLLSACTSADEPDAQPLAEAAPEPLPALSRAPLTTDETLVVSRARDAEALHNPQIPAELTAMLEAGFGETAPGEGQPVVAATLDGAAPPAPGPNAKLLVRFVHLADAQLADDESPARLAAFDAPAITTGAYRPQEGHECRILNAAVRTINALATEMPIDFVLLGGDNADNAQNNELDWFQAILGGASSVECDSGLDDDPTPGADNDPKDPFVAEGLAVPWRWVTGNHDILNQGVMRADYNPEAAVGASSAGGTRDWSQPGAPVVKGDVVPDERRAFLTRPDLLDKVAADGDGHGIDGAAKALGKAYYSFDVEDTPLRIVVLDTSAETGGSEGVVHQADVDAFLEPALDQAKADGKWVVLTSHHVSDSLTDGSSVGGDTQPDPVLPDAFRALVASYGNVIMHLAGHSHVHRVRSIAPADATPYWELQTSALADFPHQMRLVEIHDADNGFLAIRGIALDFSVEGDAVAADGRARGIIDYTSGWGEDGSGEPGHQNVELWIAKP